jgi:hypothetical protein
MHLAHLHAYLQADEQVVKVYGDRPEWVHGAIAVYANTIRQAQPLTIAAIENN